MNSIPGEIILGIITLTSKRADGRINFVLMWRVRTVCTQWLALSRTPKSYKLAPITSFNDVPENACFDLFVQVLRRHRSKDMLIILAKNRFNMIINRIYRECIATSEAITAAAAGGNLVEMKWIMEKNCPLDAEEACSVATMHGRLNVLKYLRRYTRSFSDEQVYRNAIKSGQYEILIWLHEVTGFSIPKELVNVATQSEYVKIREWGLKLKK